VKRDRNIHMIIQADLFGLDSNHRVGDEIVLTSSMLNITAENYVVSDWVYDSQSNVTTIKMHPRSSLGYIKRNTIGEDIRYLEEKTQSTSMATYNPHPRSSDP